MSDHPIVDINMFVYNGEDTVGAAIECVLAQTWPAWRLTVMDDGSTDKTAEIIADFSNRFPFIRAIKHRHNGGAVASFQRAFWHGDADFVMPKSGDDLLAPDFIEKIMAVLLTHPATAMCHAGGLVFGGQADIRALYPPSHRLHAVGPDRLARAQGVMARYTSSPGFWGVYRRDAVDRLARIRYRAGWDHALLAELALYGEIRHVADPLYWRRDGGKPVLALARSATERGGRGLNVDDPITEPHWRTPLLTTVLAHLETFSVARVTAPERDWLWQSTIEIFRSRWLPAMQRECATLRAATPAILDAVKFGNSVRSAWVKRELDSLLAIAELVMPASALVGTPEISKPRIADQTRATEVA